MAELAEQELTVSGPSFHQRNASSAPLLVEENKASSAREETRHSQIGPFCPPGPYTSSVS